MTENQTAREKTRQVGNASDEKKLYEKPAFRCEQVFETQALTCGKIAPTVGNCQFSQKTS
jgi:hypothetical protein